MAARTLTPLGVFGKWVAVPALLGVVGYFLLGPRLGDVLPARTEATPQSQALAKPSAPPPDVQVSTRRAETPRRVKERPKSNSLNEAPAPAPASRRRERANPVAPEAQSPPKAEPPQPAQPEPTTEDPNAEEPQPTPTPPEDQDDGGSGGSDSDPANSTG